VCCSVLQCVVLCCSVLQCVVVCVAVCCRVLQCVAVFVVCCGVLQDVAVHLRQGLEFEGTSTWVCYSVLQCVAMWYSVLQCVAGALQCVTVCWSALQCVAACCSACVARTLEFAGTHNWVCCSVLQCVAVCCSVLQHIAAYCSVLQCIAVCCKCIAVCCSVLQCITVCCSVLQCLRGAKSTSGACESQHTNGLVQIALVTAHKWISSNCCIIEWLHVVGSLKLYVSFTKEPYKRHVILQKRPIILRSLLIVVTPYDFCRI